CALVLLLAACGTGEAVDDPGAGTGQEGGRGMAANMEHLGSQDSLADSLLVRTDDPELREMARRLLPDLARRSGLELREPVRIARRTREELVNYLTAKLNEDLPPERAESVTATYELLGLLPEGFDLREILLSVYTEQVAGFYDPDSVALFVMDDQPAASLETVLIHELVHAVQDQATDLDSLTAPARGNDRQVAAQAAIEGHATVVMLEHLMEQAAGQAVDLSEIPDFTSQVRPALESLRGQYPALAGAPRVIQESLLFPYVEGAGYVQALWQVESGRPAPFGVHLPQSSEQVLELAREPEEGWDVPTRVTLRIASADADAGGVGRDGGNGAAAGDGGTDLDPVYENSMGEMEVRILLEEVAGADLAGIDVGWDGDQYALFRDADGVESLVWYSVWDSTDDRNAFLARLEPALDRMPRVAGLESLDVAGRPGVLLEIGDPPRIRVSLSEEGA
ncbi:MAG: DUF6782 family putative metallopeptidase, partial [Gemmatimonadota bacterium]